jgi:LAO/AO transport system kinase
LVSSAFTDDGIEEVWDTVVAYAKQTKESGYFEQHRREQARHWMHQTIEHALLSQFYADETTKTVLADLEAQVLSGETSSSAAAQQLLLLYRDRAKK